MPGDAHGDAAPETATPAAGQTGLSGSAVVDRLSAALVRHRVWVFLGLAALYLAAFTGQWRMGEDSALYLVLGRSLAEGEGYRFGGEWHRVGYPGLPYLAAPLFALFGDRGPDAATWLMLPIAAATLALAYRWVRLAFGAASAVAVVALMGVAENFFRYAFQVRNDMPFLLGVVALLAGYEALRRGQTRGPAAWANWALVVGGLVMVTYMRPVMLVTHAAVLAAACVGVARGPQRRTHAGLAAASVAALVLFFSTDPRRASPADALGTKLHAAEASGRAPVGAYESGLVGRLVDFPATLARGLGDYWVELTWDGIAAESLLKIELGGGVPNAVFAVAVLLGGVALGVRRPLWGLLVLGTLGQFLIYRPYERYLLPIFPLLLLAVWLGVRWAARRVDATAAVALLVGIGGLFIGPNVVKCIVEAATLRAGQPLVVLDGGDFAGVPAMAAAVERHVPETATVISEEARILELVTRRPGVEPRWVIQRWNEAPSARPVEAWAVPLIPTSPAMTAVLDAEWVRVGEEAAVDADPPHGPGWRLVRVALDRGEAADPP